MSGKAKSSTEHRSLLRRGLDAIFGYDFFISYTRRDGGKIYAERLARRLEAAGFNVFFDSDDYAMGDDWKAEGTWALRRTSQLIVVASPEALSAPAVVREVGIYSRLQNRRIIPIDFGGTVRNRDETKPIFEHLRPEILFLEEEAARLGSDPSNFIVRKLQDGFNLRRQDSKRLRVFTAAAVVLALVSVLAIAGGIVALQQRDHARRQTELAIEARNEAQRRQKRAEGAELRALLQRLDGFIEQAETGGDDPALEALNEERRVIADQLQTVTVEHQQLLAREIDFRGDLGFLMRWEGHAGKVDLLGPSIVIDPSTDLAAIDEQTVRARYGFLLTPGELSAVLAAVGKRGDEAQAAYRDNPILQRIALAPADVARLVPEVAAPYWLRLVQKFPALAEEGTPAEVQTAMLSASFNMGLRFADEVADEISGRNWLAVADALEAKVQGPVYRRFPDLVTRRKEEATLIRASVAQ
jgi:hypothetical protein